MDAQSRKLQLDKVWTDISAKFPDVPVMSVKQLNERIKNTDPKLVIVDTRSLDEMKVSLGLLSSRSVEKMSNALTCFRPE